MIKIKRVFLNTDMRLGHDGLTHLAHQEKIEIQTLDVGEFVLFINHRQDRLKLFTCNGILAYMRSPDNRPMDLRALAQIPRAFHASGRIDYDKEMKALVMSKLSLNEE